MRFLILTLATMLTACVTTTSSHHNSDQDEAKQTVIEMVNAIDAKEWASAQKTFAESVFVDYSSMNGQPGTNVKSSMLVGGWKNLLAKVETHHLLGNYTVEQNGSEVEVQSHVYASHTAEGIEYWDIYGRYIHKLKKTQGGWKITSMTLIVYGQKGNLEFLKQVSQ